MSGELVFYGRHTCLAALCNPKRHCIELMVSGDSNRNVALIEKAKQRRVKVSNVSQHKMSSMLPKQVNHQDVALLVSPLQNCGLEVLRNDVNQKSCLVMLDQVTNVQNMGTSLRLSACFNVDCIIVPRHNSTNECSSLAKVASGALDNIPIVYATNLVTTTKELKSMGYWFYALDCSASQTLSQTKFDKKSVIVMGSEDNGIRRLVKEHCDELINIPIRKMETVDSLNVASALAIALYKFSEQHND